MRNGFSFLYQDEDSYMIGEFKDDQLNGWGAKIYKVGTAKYLERGYFNNGKLNGIGTVIVNDINKIYQQTGYYEDGFLLSFDEIKSILKAHNYSWAPQYNGDVHPRVVTYYGTIGEDKLPKGFGVIDDEDKIYYIHYNEEGYRVGLFFYPCGSKNYNEFLYDIKRSGLTKKEWKYILRAGIFLDAEKLRKKLKQK